MESRYGYGYGCGKRERHRALPKHKRNEVRGKAEPDAYRPAKSIHFRDMRASSTSMSSGNTECGNIGDVYKMSTSGTYQLPAPAEIKHGDVCAEEDMCAEEDGKEWIDDRDRYLMEPNLTWEKKVLRVLHMIRRRELIEFDHKLNYSNQTRFCEFNIAFFDLDKESEVMHGPLFYDIPESNYRRLDDSINVISIKVAESDLSGTINIYGTVLARDQYDYKCVYLFKREREDPQPISPKDNMLTLTGPNRALAGLGCMYFEFHLKVKGEGVVDQVFSKGMKARNACCDTGESRTISLESHLSKVDVVYTPVSYAVDASLGINVLNGKSNFFGKVIAQTTNDENEIIMYDSEVTGTETELGYGGLVKLARSVVAVPRDEKLMLRFTVSRGDHKSLSLLLPRWNSVEQLTTKLGPYKMQLKIIWKGVLMQRPNLFGDWGQFSVKVTSNGPFALNSLYG